MTLNKNIILFKKLLQPIVLPAIVVLFTFLNSLTVNNIVGKKKLGSSATSLSNPHQIGFLTSRQLLPLKAANSK